MSITIEHENTFRTALAEGINLFLGAGFSVLAKSKKDQKLFPTGSQLKAELLEHFELNGYETLSLSRICTIIESTRRNDLQTFLKNRFSVDEFDIRYKSIEQIELEAIFTTNIDDLIYKIFAHSKNYYLNDILHRGPIHDRIAVDYIPLHGTVIDENLSLNFSTLNIASSFQADPDKWHFLTAQLQKSPTLFWGHSIEDADVLEALSPNSIQNREHRDKWIVLPDPDKATADFFRALDFKLITGATSDMLDYLTTTIKRPDLKAGESAHKDFRGLFPGNVIPSIGEVATVPLMSFFLGGPPDWYNIFANRIYKSHHYEDILDCIHSDTSLIVIGMVACGKSTLMMQVASNLSFLGPKLIFSSLLTPEKVHYICNNLGNERAIVFVDDCCADAEALKTLLITPNIQVTSFATREHLNEAN